MKMSLKSTNKIIINRAIAGLLTTLLLLIFCALPLYLEDSSPKVSQEHGMAYISGKYVFDELFVSWSYRTHAAKLLQPYIYEGFHSVDNKLHIVFLIIFSVGYIYYPCHRKKLKMIASYKVDWKEENASSGLKTID